MPAQRPKVTRRLASQTFRNNHSATAQKSSPTCSQAFARGVQVPWRYLCAIANSSNTGPMTPNTQEVANGSIGF